MFLTMFSMTLVLLLRVGNVFFLPNYDRHARGDSCGYYVCNATTPDCLSVLEKGNHPLGCRDGGNLCETTHKFFIDADTTDPDEYISFSDSFIENVFLLNMSPNGLAK